MEWWQILTAWFALSFLTAPLIGRFLSSPRRSVSNQQLHVVQTPARGNPVEITETKGGT